MFQKRRSKGLFLMLCLGLLLALTGFTVGAYASDVAVYVPSIPGCLHRGYWRKIDGVTGWVGSTNIYIDGVHYNAYCIEYDVYLYAGYTYTATVTEAPDLPKWRSISYILTWYHSPSINNDMGFAIQAALWKYVTGTDPTGASDTSGSLAWQIYSDAQGKNVARPGDRLTLTPDSSAVPVGQPQRLTAKLVNASGYPKAGVKIKFSTSLGVFTDTGTDETEGITDANGEVVVEVKSAVEGVAEVTASTRGMWAYILDLRRNGKDYQNLIGVGYPEIVVKSDVVFVRFFVIPEVPLGTAVVTLTSLAALLLASKMERRG